jgi:predicted transcriptional regulator
MPMDELWTYLTVHPGLTATQLAKRLGRDVASLSSQLKRLCDQGVLRREVGGGPRGGYTYFPKFEPKRTGPEKTSWQHILDEDDDE